MLKNNQGVAALLTIIIVSSAVLIMAYSASLLGLGELDMGYISQQGSEAFAVADGCMEEALRHFRLDTNYSGGSLNLGDGSCTITVTGTDPNRIFTIESTVNDYYKKIESTISFSESVETGVVITIVRWEELSS